MTRSIILRIYPQSRTGTLLNRDKLGQYSREFRVGDEIRIGFKQFDENMNNETDESCFVLSFQVN